MDPESVMSIFQKERENNPDQSDGIAATKTLQKILQSINKDLTFQEVSKMMENASGAMMKVNCSLTSVQSSTALFRRYITLTVELQENDFKKAKEAMVSNGEKYLKRMMKSREKIAKLSSDFIRNGMKILTHSKSRVVLQSLFKAADEGKKFKVYVTESRPDNSGVEVKKLLDERNIPCTLVLDSAMGFIMESVDIVIVGAEGVCISGGIINKVGTYQLAICAKKLNKAFYVLAETFKFVKIHPFNERTLPDNVKFQPIVIKSKKNLETEHPIVDYTPPDLITLVCTDLGILPPSAVCDVLIQAYL
uniref:Translation initiation factor eIF2B subunit alpha n=1 Tax=Artemia sinica TaxID=112780 RepID=A0A6G6XE69_9CRUS|nr:translation initiation factor 2B [Artemia sinica]